MGILNFGITDKLARRLFPSAGPRALPTLTRIREGLFKRSILTRDVMIFSIATLSVENPLLNCSREQGTRGYFERSYGTTLGPYDVHGFPKWGGRGLSQLTGQSNYELMAKLLHEPKILSEPDCLLDPALSAEVFCEFINHPYYLDHLFDEARRRYNGGDNGFSEFQVVVKLAQEILA